MACLNQAVKGGSLQLLCLQRKKAKHHLMTVDIPAYEKHLAEQLLSLYPAGEARAIASLVLEHLTGLPASSRRLATQWQALPAFSEKAEAATQRLLQAEPVQYVLGEAWFYHRRWLVSPATLIPRPETEELVAWALDLITPTTTPQQVLDVGTGTGCIAISLALAQPQAEVYALDVSKAALEVARQNAQMHQARVSLQQMDFTNPDNWAALPPFNLVISNPPYIPWQEAPALDAHVRQWEPKEALFVPNTDALLFYRLLRQFAATHITNGGYLLMECHYKFAAEVEQLFNATGFTTMLKQDMSGLPRMVLAQKGGKGQWQP